jgi:hypothetical protein
MKKLLFIFLLIILFSCKKETSYCWRCELYSNLSNKVINVSHYCDTPVSEIMEIEYRDTDQFFIEKCTKY